MEAAEKRLNALSGIPVLALTTQAQEIAQSMITTNATPKNAEEDALHVAVASLNGIGFLLTWNFSHINNAFKKSGIVKVIEEYGFRPPEICSPDEIIGG